MNESIITLIIITFIVILVLAAITTIILIKNHQKKKYQRIITDLERDKNLIVSASILSELKKIDSLINSEAIKNLYDDFLLRFNNIKDIELPKITDELINLESIFDQHRYRQLEPILAKVELEIFYIKNKARFLLNEIKDITLSEEKNRERVTKLKKLYREVYSKFHKNRIDYKMVINPIELQFENIDKLFAAFESSMEAKKFEEIGKIVRALDDTIGNLKIVIEESPTIILMGQNLIPKKISDVKVIFNRLSKSGYNLDYLNIEYNISEAQKKIADVFDRLNVLNLEDSIFDLRTISDYFDSLYNDFDKEKISKKMVEDFSRHLIIKIRKYQSILNNLYRNMDEIKYTYDLGSEDLAIIDVLDKEIKDIAGDYEILIENMNNKSFAYSKLCHEFELVNNKLTKTEEKIEKLVTTLGSFKEDEKRAYEQLKEIKEILIKAKKKMNQYKLPIVPKNYFVELSETMEAISEVVKVLDGKPISIRILNTRVDTARDLVLKLYMTSKEIIKTAYMAETSIVYGNRYRSINKEVGFGLAKAESFFYKGNYKASLECSINAINLVEPGIHTKLLEPYQK